MERGVPPPSRLILYALLQKHPELLPILKEAGANPNDEDGFHNTALGHAVNCYPVEVVKTLLELGADPNKESTHLLPLVQVAHDDQIECVKALLSCGANPNCVQRNGVTPLQAAVRNGQEQVVKLLLERGADPEIRGPDGRTSVELAVFSKQTDLVRLLKAHVNKHSGRLKKAKVVKVSSKC
jgi:cytohesin